MSMQRAKYYSKMAIHGALAFPFGSARVAKQSSLSVFTYHSFCVGKPPANFPSLPAAMFERQIRMLKRRYQVVSLLEGLQRLGESSPCRRMAAITIDDGFADNYHVAWPILRRHGVPALVFLATDFIDQRRVPWPTRLMDIVNEIVRRAANGSSHEGLGAAQAYGNLQNTMRGLPADERFEELDRLVDEYALRRLPERPPMSWDQIREMKDTGIAFGSHTVYHGMLPFLGDAEAAFELADSKRRIEEELQCPCDFLAYPNGDWDAEVVAELYGMGYRAAVTQDFGVNIAGGSPYVLRRVEVPSHDPLASYAYRAKKALNACTTNG
jgi:peptidoglycan/xylan/chitin deacetylase (PgdA/CDA1 family)